MTPFRIFEIVLYSLLDFLPYMLILIYPFRKKLRFSVSVSFWGLFTLTLIYTAAMLYTGLHQHGNGGIVNMAGALTAMAFSLVMIKAHVGKTLFTVLMLTNISNFILILSKCIEGFLFPAQALEPYRWTLSCVMLFVEGICLVPLFFFIKKTYAYCFDIKTSRPLWRFLFLIPLVFFIVWYYHIYGMHDGHDSLDIALNPTHSIYMLIINLGALLFYYIIVLLIREIDKNETLQDETHQLAMQKLQYENLNERINEARQAKHDIRHHIAVMDGYVESGDYEKLRAYLQSYRRALPDDRSIVFCKNHATNALLLYFAQQAKNHNIDYDASVNLPEEIALPENEISVLLGNLLENALEACISAGEEHLPTIKIRGSSDHDSVYFHVENTYTGEVKQNKLGQYLSTKHEGRGIGLSSVRSIVARHDGMIEINHDNGIFSVKTVLLNSEKQSSTKGA